ncbi:MAG TPA: substrate-binding domain-containing protein [Solirubrobacteraceae bacterium]|nr:substrate-binding domain-containing protein [Solirubrobacteraceae bacterium]
MRRAVPMGMVATAALALGLPGVASAKKPKAEVLEQCSGPRIEAVGSTFQAPLQFIWSGINSDKGNEVLDSGYNHSSSGSACSGTQGSKAKAEFYYNQEEINRGSGACLKTLGEGVTTFGETKIVDGKEETYPRVNKYPLCGTDEAPKQSVKESMEKFADDAAGFEGGKGEAIESLPVAQGSEAIIVHLPKDCLASSEMPAKKGKFTKLGRLALDQEVIAGIYEGKIKTWLEAIEAQGEDGHDMLTCTEGGENDTIRPVVRADKSGTTHIFKAFLLQVYTGKFPAEEFKEVNKGEKPCKESERLDAGVEVSWEEVSEGCENQRWPEEAHVLRPTETGNPGVVHEVNSTESSIGYADLSVASEYGYFSKKADGGGENTTGEQNKEFWALVQNSAPGVKPVTFMDPQTNGDVETPTESNCKDTKYVAAKGEEFPPKSTRDDWSKVKGENVSATYPICGVTYELAPRQEWYFLEPYGVSEARSLELATSVHDYLAFITAKKGGQTELVGSDYAALPKGVAKEDETGAAEIGSKKA